MSSLGLAMFLKGILVGLWAIGVDYWEDFRQRRAERGLPLKRNRQGVYEVSDWTAKVNTTARGIRTTTFILLGVWWAFLLFGWLVMGERWLTDAIIWLLFSPG